jgi:hypothetical protein
MKTAKSDFEFFAFSGQDICFITFGDRKRKIKNISRPLKGIMGVPLIV